MAANSNSMLTLPTFIPLSEAVHKYDITEDVLTQLVQNGRIEAAQLPSGDILVADSDLDQTRTKEQIIEEKFAHLRGKAITISEATAEYALAGPTIRKWISRGFISPIGSSYPMTIDEADVAYCRWAYQARNGRPGAQIFDSDGMPYELKHPELAEYRREKQHRMA